MQADLIDWWKQEQSAEIVEPWKPRPLNHDQWPPDYQAVYAWRIKTLAELNADPELARSAKAYYSLHKKEFIMHWMDTYDPRKAQKWIPFVFFIRQAEFIDFLDELNITQESGLVEKCRDMGATWLACGYSVASWLFIPNDAIGWGSRKEILVDKLGDPDSIFEKIRLIIRRLPKIFLPEGLDDRKHLSFMKCINPENGATITGESGDNIGRGGRKRIYFKDESAHYEHPENIEAALGDNTNIQVDISSVNGLNNPFYRRRKAGIVWSPHKEIDKGYTRVFIIDWRDHPEKTQEWYDNRRAKYEREGLLHIFAQEVDRNYSAAVSNTVIPYEHIQAAIDAHLRIPCLMRRPEEIPNINIGGLDVADGGVDRNAFAIRQWVILRYVDEWGSRDVGVTTRKAMMEGAKWSNLKIMYDAVGMGATVKAEYNRIKDENLAIQIPKFVAWNAGAGVIDPYERIIKDDLESLTNQEYYYNLKAQAWVSCGMRFYKTWKCIQAIEKNQTIPNYNADELISLDSKIPLLYDLMNELAQATRNPTSNLRTIIDKAPEGTKSPNLADAVVMSYFPIPDDYGTVLTGSYR